MSQANVEIVRSIIERMAKRESTADLVAEDLEYINPPYAVEAGVRRGRDALGGVLDIYPNFSYEVERYIDAGDDVVVIGAAAGTSPSGLPASWRMGQVWTISDGKAIRFRWFTDPAEALAVVGLEED